MINESKRDNLLQPFVDIYNQKTGENATVSQMKQALLKKLVNEANIRNLSLTSNYYLAGAARYYFNGDLTVDGKVGLLTNEKDNFNVEICERLSALILILRNAYIDSVGTQFEQPEDFGELSLKKLLRKYGAAINKELGIDPKKGKKEEEPLNTDNHVGNGYTFDIIYSYEEARKYNRATEPGAWCITYGEHHYDYYKNRHNIHYVIFLKDGYENVPRKVGPGWSRNKPHDEYGNSMIALLQKNSDGEPFYITSRWNHGVASEGTSCEADYAYTKEEFFNIVGINDEDLQRIQKIWLKNRTNESIVGDARKKLNAERLSVLRQFKYAQMRLNGGDPDPFDGNKIQDFVPMTNVEKFKTLVVDYTNKRDASYTQEERDALKEKYISEIMKLGKNVVRACTVTLNEGKHFFLMDKNKILFETIVKADETYDRASYHFRSSEGPVQGHGYYEEKAMFYNNIVVCCVVNGIMLYNTRYHEFVKIGNKTKFKYIYEDSTKRENVLFYEVKMSGKQVALLSHATNRPIILPNGSAWMEDIKSNDGRYYWREDTRCTYYDNRCGVMQFIYDSSSGEKYLYDTRTKRFISPKINGEENYARVNYSISSKIEKNEAGIYAIAAKYTKENGAMGTKNLLYRNGEPFYIDGTNELPEGITIADGFGFNIAIPKEGVGGFIYDCTTGEKYEPPIPVRAAARASYHDKCRMILFSLPDSTYGARKYVMFDTQTKTWLKNPETDNFIFDSVDRMDEYSRENGMAIEFVMYISNPGDRRARAKYTLPPGSSTFVVNQLQESKIAIKMNDIKEMVTECVKKIFI